MLNDSDKRILMDIARQAVESAVRGGQYAPPVQAGPALTEKCGCFVTLRTGGRLRGCLGCFTSTRPLYQTIAEYARHSALEDPRFFGNRLRPGELAELHIEISVLSPLKPCADPQSITLGVDGIYVVGGMRSGCFLPQVATETGWSVEEFWGHCCRDKAGLEWDAWKRPGIEVSTFTAEVFS